jgi:UV radiation resistance-associated gene protein
VTPAKQLVNEEQALLSHSKSDVDLKKVAQDADSGEVGKDRPKLVKLRRRSTMIWGGASPEKRQSVLEEMTSSRLVDTFVSLHVDDALTTEPFYISEVVEKSMNPSYIYFDIGKAGPMITRMKSFTVKVWAKLDGKNFSWLMESNVPMAHLTYLGDTVSSPPLS